MSGVVTMQYDSGIDSCLVFMAEPPPVGLSKNFLEAVTMANNAHQRRGKVRALESLSGGTMATLAEVWCVWRGDGGSGWVLKWCQV